MLCPYCKKKETPTPNAKQCGSCRTRFWRLKNPERLRGAHTRYMFRSKHGGNGIKALERDGYSCRVCHKSKKVEIHHIDGNGTMKPREERNNSLDNLLTV